MLVKEFDICGTHVKLKNSAFLHKLYRAEFNRDLILDMNQVLNAKAYNSAEYNIIEDVAYAMAAHADEQIESEQDFLEMFDSGMFAHLAASPVIEMWVEGLHMTAENGKKKGRARGQTAALSSSSDAQN